MHEFSTAIGIVNAVKRAAGSHKATRVTSIRLQIGPLSMLNHDQLIFGIEIASKGTILEGAEISIEVLTIKTRCKKCGTETVVDEQRPTYELLTSLVCPKCDSKDVEIIQGRECIIRDVKAVVNDE
jgi:hydrogenase nickel incorporation protein HypA/HybF